MLIEAENRSCVEMYRSYLTSGVTVTSHSHIALVSMYNFKTSVFFLSFSLLLLKRPFCLISFGVGLIIFALEMTNEDLLDYWLIPPWGNASCCVVYLSLYQRVFS